MEVLVSILLSTGFYVIKGALNEAGIISNECNQALNDMYNDLQDDCCWADYLD